MNAIWKIGLMSCCLLTAGYSADFMDEFNKHLEAIHQIDQQQQVNYEKEIESLRKELAALKEDASLGFRAKQDDYEKTIKELNEKNGDLAKNNCELIAQLAKNKEEMKAQLQELNRLSDENKQVAGEYKTLGDTIKALNSENKDLKERNSSLEQKLRESNEYLTAAESYLPEVIEKNVIIEQSAEATRKRLQMTEEDLRQAVNDLDKSNATAQYLRSENRRLQQMMDVVAAQRDQAKSAVAQTAQLAESIEQSKISLGKKNKELQEENKSLKQRIAELEGEVEKNANLSAQHETEIEELRKNYNDIAAQLGALRNEPTDLNTLRKQIDELSSEKKGVEEQKLSMQNNLDAANKKIRELKQQVDKVSTENTSLIMQINNIKQENRNLTSKNRDLQSQVKVLTPKKLKKV